MAVLLIVYPQHLGDCHKVRAPQMCGTKYGLSALQHELQVPWGGRGAVGPGAGMKQRQREAVSRGMSGVLPLGKVVLGGVHLWLLSLSFPMLALPELLFPGVVSGGLGQMLLLR